MASLEEIRAKLKAQEAGQTRSNEDGNLLFPHWNMQDGQNTTLRFLPDADPDNTFFWKERQQINLTFPGVKGHDENKATQIRVPCIEMWGDSCPILSEIRPWWKDSSLEDMARKYWKKRSYFLQGFVNETPIQEDNPPENPIRKFIMTPQIFNIIKSALLDPDMEYVPTDYDNGVNFVISRTTKGGFNDYSTSKYARRETSLTDEQRAAIDTHGLFNLNDWMPARPSADAVTAMHEMFEASVNGDLYDPDRWSQFYRPWGLDVSTSDSATGAPARAAAAAKASAPAPAASNDKAPESKAEDKSEEKADASEAAPAEGTKNAQDILARIRNRQSA